MPMSCLWEKSYNSTSLAAGAKVIQANKEAKKLSALLDSDSDTYVKNDCKADKWYIIELSQVAKITRVELAQVCGARLAGSSPH